MTYVLATPGREPTLPPAVALLSQHLHCLMHSAIVARVGTVLSCRRRGAGGQLRRLGKAAAQVASAIQAAGGEVLLFHADVSIEAEVQSMFREVIGRSKSTAP